MGTNPGTFDLLSDPFGALELAGDGPGWWAALPWLMALGLALLGVCALLLSRLVRAAEDRSLQVRQQTDLQTELRDLLAKLEQGRTDLDLRRIEHLLIDLRGVQTRVEDAMLRSLERLAESAQTQQTALREPPVPADSLVERVTNRLLAMGYERVQIVTPRAELEGLGEGRLELAVEARHGGVLHKGRVAVAAGRILDVQMQPPYALFP